MFKQMLKQDATYWAPTGRTATGALTFAAPVVMKTRWEGKVQVVTNNHGADKVSKSRAYFLTEVVSEGYLFEGISAVADPRQVAGALPIIAVSRVPDLRNNEELVTAFM
jgi:hypothetical protein